MYTTSVQLIYIYPTVQELTQYLLLDPYGSAEGPQRVVENRNLLSHPDDLRMEECVIQMT